MRIEPLALEVLGDGPPLLLIHGAGGSARMNFPFVDDLAKSYTVLAPDLPGVGSSTLGDDPLTPAIIGGRLLETLDLACVEHFVVCAYSMGTLVAAWLAAHAPQRVNGLILSAGLAHADFACQGTMARWSRLLARDPLLAGRFVVEHVYRSTTRSARGPRWVARTSAEIAATFARGTTAHIEMVRSADVRSEIATTTQPLLLIVPSADEFVTPRHGEEITSLRPDADVVYLECGHAIGDEEPARWLAAITDFAGRYSCDRARPSIENGHQLARDAG